MSYRDLITRNPDVMSGKPIIKDTRITVEILIRKLSEGASIDELLDSYPHLNKSYIYAALEYAADKMANEEILHYA